MDGAYTNLADWFEYLNKDCDYEKWSQYLHEKLLFAGVRSGIGLDIGCGSGKFTRALTKMGYHMTGFDISAQMLAKAQQLNAEEGVFPLFVQEEVRNLRFHGRADFVISVNECFNYVPQSDLAKAFGKIRGCLKKGGIFWFDISTEYKLREVIGNNAFCEDREELAYLWFNRLCDERVEMDFTMFVKRQDGLFSRSDERHVQYIHKKENVYEELDKCGFDVLLTEGAFGDAQDKMRLNFLCRRR